MDLLLVRHGRAEDRDAFARTGRPDELRPLTPGGRKRMEAAVKGLHRVLPRLGAVLSSPLVRARQTADYLGEAYGLPVTELAGLAPGGDFEDVYARAAFAGDGVVALVGHEPDLGALASHLLASATGSFLPLKKGACCLITCDGPPAAGNGRLLWLLTSAQLRLIGECA